MSMTEDQGQKDGQGGTKIRGMTPLLVGGWEEIGVGAVSAWKSDMINERLFVRAMNVLIIRARTKARPAGTVSPLHLLVPHHRRLHP
jgi:hypothetical protein